MSQPNIDPAEHAFEQKLGILLRTGVLIAAFVVFVGGVLFLIQSGEAPVMDYSFHGEPANLRSLGGIVQDALALRAKGVIQFGLLLLMLTPVLRVFFSVLGFAKQRDYVYVSLTLIVLAILLYSILS